MAKRKMKTENKLNETLKEKNEKNNNTEENKEKNKIWNITRTDSINYISNSDDEEISNTKSERKITKSGNKNTMSMQNTKEINVISKNNECVKIDKNIEQIYENKQTDAGKNKKDIIKENKKPKPEMKDVIHISQIEPLHKNTEKPCIQKQHEEWKDSHLRSCLNCGKIKTISVHELNNGIENFNNCLTVKKNVNFIEALENLYKEDDPKKIQCTNKNHTIIPEATFQPIIQKQKEVIAGVINNNYNNNDNVNKKDNIIQHQNINQNNIKMNMNSNDMYHNNICQDKLYINQNNMNMHHNNMNMNHNNMNIHHNNMNMYHNNLSMNQSNINLNMYQNYINLNRKQDAQYEQTYYLINIMPYIRQLYQTLFNIIQCYENKKVPDDTCLQRFVKISEDVRLRLLRVEYEITKFRMKYNENKKTSLKDIHKNNENRNYVDDSNLNKSLILKNCEKNIIDHFRRENINLKKILNHMSENYCHRQRMNTVLDSNNVHTLYKEFQKCNGNISPMLDILYDVDTKHNEPVSSIQQHIHYSNNFLYNPETKSSNENVYSQTSSNQNKPNISVNSAETNRNNFSNEKIKYSQTNNQLSLEVNGIPFNIFNNDLNIVHSEGTNQKGAHKSLTIKDDIVTLLNETPTKIDCIKNHDLIHNENNRLNKELFNKILIENKINGISNQININLPTPNIVNSNEPLYKMKIPESIKTELNENHIASVELQNIKGEGAMEQSSITKKKQVLEENYKKSCVLKKMSYETNHDTEKDVELQNEMHNSMCTHFLNQVNETLEPTQDLTRNCNTDHSKRKVPLTRKRNRNHENETNGMYVYQTKPRVTEEDRGNELQQPIKKNVTKKLIRKFNRQHGKVRGNSLGNQSQSMFLSAKNPTKDQESIHNISKENTRNHENSSENCLSNTMNKLEKSEENTNEINEDILNTNPNNKIYSNYILLVNENYVVPNVSGVTENKCNHSQLDSFKSNSQENVDYQISDIRNNVTVQTNEIKNDITIQVNKTTNDLPTSTQKILHPKDIVDKANTLYEKIMKKFREEGLIKDQNPNEWKDVLSKTGTVLKAKNQFRSNDETIYEINKEQHNQTTTTFPNDIIIKNKNTQQNKTKQQIYVYNGNVPNKIQNIYSNNCKMETHEVSKMSTKTSFISKHRLLKQININNNKNNNCERKHN